MKKYISIFVLLLMFFVLTPTAKAYSLDDLYASIQSLQQQVSGLQSQISATALTAITPTPTPVITKGTTSAEVTAIQSALNNQGYALTVDGNYGSKTETAVKTFQVSKGLPVTGIVDTATQTSILSTATVNPVPASSTSVTAVGPTPTVACLPTTAPWIKVVSPNGGETFNAGQQITVKWTSCNVPAATSLGINIYGAGSNSPGTVAWTPNDGIEVITIPIYSNNTGQQIPSSSNYLLSISGNNPKIADTSDNVFTILTCTDSDGGLNLSVAGVTYDAVNNNGPYTDQSVSVNGGTCSGLSCTGVTERYCKNGTLDKFVFQCPPGIYSVNGACVLN